MKCKEAAAELIDQIIDTIKVLDPGEYSRALNVYNGSSLGKHFRHIFDFFSLLCTQNQSGCVDYCRRQRDHRIETEQEYAIEQFDHLKQELAKLKESDIVTVYADFELKDGSRTKVASSIGREIMYGYDHAVHHLAIIKIGIQAMKPDIKLNKQLGVAASTIRYENEQAEIS